MIKSIRLITALVFSFLIVTGCSQNSYFEEPKDLNLYDKKAHGAEDFTAAFSAKGKIYVAFYIESDEVLEIDKQMQKINKLAYMDGHNWAAFFNHYLKMNYPELLDGLEVDPEAGTYAFLYMHNEKNLKKTEKFIFVINDLVAHPEEIYNFMKAEGDKIQWKNYGYN